MVSVGCSGSSAKKLSHETIQRQRLTGMFCCRFCNIRARNCRLSAILTVQFISLLLLRCQGQAGISPLPSACADSFASALASVARPAPSPADPNELWVFLSFCNRCVRALDIDMNPCRVLHRLTVHKCSGYVSFALNLWLSSRIAYSKLGQGSDPFLFVALDAQAERVRCSCCVLRATLTASVTGAARCRGARVDMPASRAFFFDSCSAPCLARLHRHHACSPARCRPCSVHRLQYSFV